MNKKTKLKFYPKSHKYKVGRKELTPVTRFVKRFFSDFNAKEIARKIANFKINKIRKRGVRYWLAQWKKDSEHGTTVHNAIDRYIKGVPADSLDLSNDRDIDKVTEALTFIHTLGGKLESELQIYDMDYMLAGTIDLLERTKEGINLYDWKTNKAIREKAYVEKGKEPKFGKCPIEELEDCNYNHYALQLSIYAYMLEKQGEKINNLAIVHLRGGSYVLYEIDYDKYKKYVIKMLEDENNGQRFKRTFKTTKRNGSTEKTKE